MVVATVVSKTCIPSFRPLPLPLLLPWRIYLPRITLLQMTKWNYQKVFEEISQELELYEFDTALASQWMSAPLTVADFEWFDDP